MKKYIFSIVLLCCLIFLFGHCSKDIATISKLKKGKLIDTIKLSQAEMNIVPYALNDSIVFKDSFGNSKKFKANSRRFYYWQCYEKPPDPSSDYYIVEELEVSFVLIITLILTSI